MNGRWMVYGAYGYTGELVARLAHERGLNPILAGRDQARLAPLAEELGLEHRVLALDGDLQAALADVDLVAHCAGPFSATSRPMVDACLATGTWYLDVTGELGVFEAIAARDAEARAAGVGLLPGAGFDVVPTDCAAALVHRALPDATHLEIAFSGGGGSSGGTARSAIEALPRGGQVRIDGELRRVPFAWKHRTIPFPGKPLQAMAIPWGDLVTAWQTTGIGNITTYMAMPPRVIRQARWLDRLRPVLALGVVQRGLARQVSRRVKDPTPEQRAAGTSLVWTEARNPAGDVATVTLTAPNGYTFTARSVLACAERLLAERPVGALTPALAFGPDFVATIPGVRVDPVITTRA